MGGAEDFCPICVCIKNVENLQEQQNKITNIYHLRTDTNHLTITLRHIRKYLGTRCGGLEKYNSQPL